VVIIVALLEVLAIHLAVEATVFLPLLDLREDLVDLEIPLIPVMVDQGLMTVVLDPLRMQFLVFLEMITQSSLKSLRRPCGAMVWWRVDTLLLLNQNARLSISVPTMVRVD